jgi:hypothetical protein
MAPLRVGVVPHTHWDREWHTPFEAQRLALLPVLDEILHTLERDPSITSFLLDGQTAIVDDYLELRPDAESRIARLVAAGRLQVGPWAVLPDELLVSGETLVRDLQAGIARAERLGGVMEVGYLPDSFGHTAQMPQLLASARIRHAVVWRGVPAAIDRSAFRWCALDGSSVRAEHLYGSYANGRDLPRDAGALVERAREYLVELGALRTGDLLLMNGGDHRGIEPWVGQAVEAANAGQQDLLFGVTPLLEHLERQPVDGLPSWTGELRSSARTSVLAGVVSNRVDVRRAAAEAERTLERAAEPLAALFCRGDDHPTAAIDRAWTLLVRNAAHDSVCACSADDVVDEVLVRYRTVAHVAGAVADGVRTRVAREVDAPPGTFVVLNPTGRARSDLVEVVTPVVGPLHAVGPDGTLHPVQVLAHERPDVLRAVVTGQKIRWVAGLARGSELAGQRVARWNVEPAERAGTYHVTVDGARPGEPSVDVDPLRARLLDLAEQGATAHVHARATPTRRVLVRTPTVPPFGWSTFRVLAGDGPPGTVSAQHDRLSNEHLTVTLDDSTATWSIRTQDGLEVTGLGRLVDGGDGGDTYTWSPPDEDTLVDAPVRTAARVLEDGPLRAVVAIAADYEWPIGVEGDHVATRRRSPQTTLTTVTTRLELRVGEPFVRVSYRLEHATRDHRLRAHFPLPCRVTGADAGCAFGVVRRGLTAEGGPHERGVATHPAHHFVDASDSAAGLAVLTDAVTEYEVVDGGRELTVTLLRATGFLSRLAPAHRPEPAGPPLPLRGAQVPGPLGRDFAVMLHRGDWRSTDIPAHAAAFTTPLEAVERDGAPGPRAAEGQLLLVEGAEVSSVTRDAHDPARLLVRVVRLDAEPGDVDITLHGRRATGERVDLRGETLTRLDDPLVLRGFEIATLRLER